MDIRGNSIEKLFLKKLKGVLRQPTILGHNGTQSLGHNGTVSATLISGKLFSKAIRPSLLVKFLIFSAVYLMIV